jgi:hypothetical protein
MKFRKKPVVIDAIQWTGDNYAEIFEFTEGWAYPSEPHSDTLIVYTPDGEIMAQKGSYIVCKGKGNYYPLTEDYFNKTYEKI